MEEDRPPTGERQTDTTEEDRPQSTVSLRAEELVTGALERAHRAVMNDLHPRRTPTPDPPAGHTVAWVSCEGFTVDIGRTQIAEYISTWGLSPRWLLALVFLVTSQEEHHLLHRYRARLSLPSARAPVPTDTASVWFSVRLWRSRPPSDPVEVSYTVEASRLEDLAGGHPSSFRESWLEEVLRSKALLRRAVDF